MKLTKIAVDTERVQDILYNYGTTFERPVDIEKLAIEIFASCRVVQILESNQLKPDATFEVSFSDGN